MTDQAIDPERRFAGISRLYGAAGAQRLRAAHVAVVGIGGVGSWTAEALARSGVGCLTLVDMDHVSESNINRQVHALDSTLGMAKVQAMRERIAGINPSCLVYAVDDFAGPGNWPALMPGPMDALIDACDQLQAKTVLARWAVRQRLPFVVVGAAGGKTGALGVQVADLAQVTHDRLLAKMRYDLRRKHGFPRSGKMGVRCVYSSEVMQGPGPLGGPRAGGGLSCHGYGSSVVTTASFGLCAAGVIIGQLANHA